MSWCDTVQSTAAAWNEGGYVWTVGIWQFIYKEQTRTCHLAAILCFSCNKFTRSWWWAEIWRLHFLCKSSSTGDEFLYIWGKWPPADREQFADRCARVKAILLRDRFDHCSHTSDEVVQITACLAGSLLLEKWNIRIRFRRTMVKGWLQVLMSINLSWHFCLLYTFRSGNVTRCIRLFQAVLIGVETVSSNSWMIKHISWFNGCNSLS